MALITTTEQQFTNIFDSFYSFTEVVNSSEFDVVHGYFMTVTPNKNIADNFSSLLFRIANQTKIPAMTLLSYIQGKSSLEMTKLLAYYINSLKSKTALYGITSVPRSNQTAAREILS
jgi:hypothetical protein